MSNQVAEDGYIFVCLVCGKRSKDRYGDQAINYGWDVSCVLNSQEVPEHKIILGDDQRVKEIH